MELWTIQIAQWRKLQGTGIELIDTTVKSQLHKPFAPTWDLVMGYKSGEFSEAFYREQYIELMRHSYRSNPDYWLTFLTKDKIALGCMCRAGQFCHRHILNEIFVGLCVNKGLPIVQRGEYQ